MGRDRAARKGYLLAYTFKPDANTVSCGGDHLYTEIPAGSLRLFQQAQQFVPGFAFSLFAVDGRIRVGISRLKAGLDDRQKFVLR